MALLGLILKILGAFTVAAGLVAFMIYKYGQPPKVKDPWKGMYHGKKKEK